MLNKRKLPATAAHSRLLRISAHGRAFAVGDDEIGLPRARRLPNNDFYTLTSRSSTPVMSSAIRNNNSLSAEHRADSPQLQHRGRAPSTI